MTEPTTTQLVDRLKEIGLTVDLYKHKMTGVAGHEYTVWKCDLYRKRKAFTGYGGSPKTAVLSAMFETMLTLL